MGKLFVDMFLVFCGTFGLLVLISILAGEYFPLLGFLLLPVLGLGAIMAKKERSE